jgi:pimeloyl-ACP methyl ester carboxylesterase
MARAEAVLFLHAFPLDGTLWRPQLDALAAERPSVKAVAPSYPGFRGGEPLRAAADGGPAVLTMDAAADAAVRALDAAKVERALVVGESMGGYVALALWRRHRARVAGFVFANTRAGADDEAGKAKRRDLARRLLAEGNQFLVDNPPALLAAQADSPLWTVVKTTIAAQPAGAIAAASLGMAARPDSTGDLASIDVPTLVLSSTADTLIPPAASEPLARGIPGARFVVLPDVGHLTNLEAPQAFNRLVVQAFDRTFA